MGLNMDYFKALDIEYFYQFSAGEGVRVAVLDSELLLEHREFKGKNIDYKEFINSKEENYHGTAISGLIVGNHLGVAPKSELIHRKVLSEQFGTGKAWGDGIASIANKNIDIVCMSLGTKSNLSLGMTQSLQDLKNKGVAIVAPAGNNGVSQVYYPANDGSVIAVGGINEEMRVSKKSNRHRDIEAYAPSEDILVASYNNTIKEVSGTSFANAIFAGQLALILSYVRKIDKEENFNLNNFVVYYNQNYRMQKKVFNMKIVKEALDIYLNL